MQFKVPALSEAVHKPLHPDALFIDGEWSAPAEKGRLELISPVSEESIGSVAAAGEADIDRAVAAARRAFDHGPWPRMTVAERAARMRRLGELLTARAEALSYLWTLEAGAPHFFTSRVSERCGMIANFYAELAEEMNFVDPRRRTAGGYGVVVREPVGVVAAVVPWNAPVFLAMIKMAPALMAGCTIVIKPAPETPLDAYILAECVEQAGFPAGTVNIVAAERAASDRLIRHPGIDKVSFTGSTETGRHIMKAAADRFARVTLELGGKSAAIVLDDLPIEKAIPGIVAQVSGNCGQACVALSRLLVPSGRHDEYAEALADAFTEVRIGDPFDPTTQIGTLAMKRQYDRVSEYVEFGRDGGAKLVVGGGRPKHIEHGYFFEPTLFANASNDMRIAREEIFGPIVAMIPYDTVDEAIEIANDSDYGLHGAIFTEDFDLAYQLGRRLRTGNVGVLGNTMDLTMPFGGWKQSGIGREGGPEGLLSFTELKTIYLPELPSAAVG